MTKEAYEKKGKFQFWFTTLTMPLLSYFSLFFSILTGEQYSSRVYELWQRDPIGTLVTFTAAVILVTFCLGPVCYWMRPSYSYYNCEEKA